MTSEKGRLKGEKRSNAIIAHIALYASLCLLTLTITKTKAQDSVQLQTDSLQSVPSVITDTVSAVRISATKLIDASTSLQGKTAESIFHPFPKSRFRRFCDSLSMSTVALSALVLPGAGQIINGDYWKVPLVTGSVVGFTWASVYFHRRYNSLLSETLSLVPSTKIEQESRRIEMRSLRNGSIVAAAVSYSLGVADALVNHSPNFKSPFAALVSSALLPGLGQMYTHSYWKVPIIYGAAVYLTSQFMRMDQLYRRFDKALTYLLDENPETIDEFEGKRSRQDIQYFRDYYRRNRDLSLLGLSLLYVLNVIDAYVGAHLYYWNVDSDLAMRIYPSLTPSFGNASSGVLAMNFNLYF